MTLTVTATNGSLDVPAVLVSVVSSPAVTAPLTLYRVHEDGTRYRVLTEANANVITTWTGFDFHAPFNQWVTYVAEAAGLVSAGSPAVMVISDDATWLIHPSDPDLTVLVDKIIGPAAPYKYPGSAQVFRPLGSKLPVVRTSYPRGGESGQITVKCESPDSRAAVMACLEDNGPTLINTPNTADDIGWKWVQFGDVDKLNPGGFTAFPFRYVVLPYMEVTQPDVDASLWTLGELKTDAALNYPTLGGVKAEFATLGALKLRIPS